MAVFACSLERLLDALAGNAVQEVAAIRIGLKPQDASKIANALKGNTAATKLDLSCNRLGAAGTCDIADAIEGTSVADLDLSQNELGPEGPEVLRRLLLCAQSLTRLCVLKNGLGEGAATTLGRAIRRCSTLRDLDLAHNNLGPRVEELASALGVSQSLESLDLARNGLTNVGVGRIVGALTNNTSLTRLNLERNIIGPEGLKRLCKLLKQNQALQELNLGSSSFDDASSRALAAALASNTALTCLNISNSGCCGAGFTEVARALKTNRGLKQLNVENNSIGDQGAKDLAEALKVNSTLQELNLQSNSVAEAGAAALLEALETNICVTSLLLVGSTGIGLKSDLASTIDQAWVNLYGAGTTFSAIEKMASQNRKDRLVLALSVVSEMQEVLVLCFRKISGAKLCDLEGQEVTLTITRASPLQLVKNLVQELPCPDRRIDVVLPSGVLLRHCPDETPLSDVLPPPH